MKFRKQKINGIFLIEPEPIMDKRGMYRRHFCQNEFKTHSLSTKVAQSNIVENLYAFTLRGFHYQVPPYAEAKTLSCIRGAIYDIVVDLRPESPTYLQWIGFELNDNNRNSLYIPPGCSHAALTLVDNTIVHYYSSAFYNPKAERGIRFDDPLFGFKWPYKPEIISDKDRNHPNFTPLSESK